MFLSLSGAEIYSPYVGDSEKAVREVFKRARAGAPAIIFLDEVDALVGKRSSTSAGNNIAERVLSTVLNEVDGIESAGDVVVVAATNRLQALDPAFLRPGRMDRKVFIGLPDPAARRAVLGVHAGRMPLSPEVDLDRLASITEGFSGAGELMSVFRHRTAACG